MTEELLNKSTGYSLKSAQKMHQIRERRGLSFKDVANACNVTEMAIRNYEQGIRQINEERLQDIANALEVNPGAIKEHNVDTLNDVMHILFEFENAELIQPIQLAAPETNSITPFGVRSVNEVLNESIQLWFACREQWINGQLSDDDYQNWKDMFPTAPPTSHMQTESSENEAQKLEPQSKKTESAIRKHLLMFQSLESRFLSMNYAKEVSAELQERISNYVNCSIDYLNDRNCIKFTPEESKTSQASDDRNIIFDILDIMDKHTDSEQYRTIQIQLSRIVLYHVAQKGFLVKVLRAKELPQQKTDFLFEGVKPLFNANAFGYFYTELSFIRELTGMSYREMFTGVA